MATERTLSIIKPDATRRNLTGDPTRRNLAGEVTGPTVYLGVFALPC